MVAHAPITWFAEAEELLWPEASLCLRLACASKWEPILKHFKLLNLCKGRGEIKHQDLHLLTWKFHGTTCHIPRNCVSFPSFLPWLHFTSQFWKEMKLSHAIYESHKFRGKKLDNSQTSHLAFSLLYPFCWADCPPLNSFYTASKFELVHDISKTEGQFMSLPWVTFTKQFPGPHTNVRQ